MGGVQVLSRKDRKRNVTEQIILTGLNHLRDVIQQAVSKDRWDLSWCALQVSTRLVGLALAHVLNMSGRAVRQTAETENDMTSVERMLEYTKLPQVPAYHLSTQVHPFICSQGCTGLHKVVMCLTYACRVLLKGCFFLPGGQGPSSC